MHSIIFALTFLHLSTYTSGHWLFEPHGPPVPPPPGEKRTCEDWIAYYSFGDDTKTNREMAQERAKQHDNDVSIWAVMYAQILVAFPKIGQYFGFEPLRYCTYFQGRLLNQARTLSVFETFISTEKTCEEWIHLYYYRLNDRNKTNWYQANDRDKLEDVNISVWAAGYGRFIVKQKSKNYISVAQYCKGIGLSDSHNMKFMSFNGTTKTCRGWVELSEYGNNMDENQRKFREHDKIFSKFINNSTKRYIDHLRKYYAPRMMGFGCGSSSAGVTEEGPLTPEQFCNKEGMNEDVSLTYFE